MTGLGEVDLAAIRDDLFNLIGSRFSAKHSRDDHEEGAV
jgi:hypothetical protein